MSGSRRTMLVLAGLLLVAYLAGWAAEGRWNQQAREAARQRLVLKLPEAQRDPALSSSDADLLHRLRHSGSGQKWLASEPWGAEVWHAGRRLGATPIEWPSVEETLQLRTPWRRAEVKPGQTSVALSAGPLTVGLNLAGLLGVALLIGGLVRGRPGSEPPPDGEVETSGEAASAPSGPMFGDYRRGEFCGSGAMGVVYRAYRESRPDRPYALKVLNAEWGQSEEFRQRFEREYQICRQLDSDRVVRVHAQGEKDGQLWMAMDFVEGPTLDGYLAKKPGDPREVLRLAVELCEGLAYAHGLGIVHRDLKPENILVNAQGHPVITDFGLARSQHYATITRAHTVMGTPAYMAPEQVEGSGIDQRADLYSLGCILYEALAGRPPFLGEAMDVVLAQLTRQPEPLSQHVAVSSECEALVHRLLAKDKNSRFSSADQVKEALLVVLETAG